MNDTNLPAGEFLVDIPANRTLIAKKLTVGEVLKPEVVHGLETLEQVFEHYHPSLNFRFENAQGFIQSEELKFRALEDFSLNNMMKQSSVLSRHMARKQIYLKLAAQVKMNQSLKHVLGDVGKRKAFEAMVNAMIEDLKQSK